MKIRRSILPIRTVFGLGLAVAPLACVANAQTVEGTIDLQFRSIDTTYNVFLYENGNQWGTPNEYAAVQTLSESDLTSSTLALGESSPYALEAFGVEVGEAPAASSETYQILGSNSVAFVDSTNLPGIPDPQASPAAFELNSGITATGGIGAYRAGELQLLYGYAFGNNGVLGSAYSPDGLSAVDQVAFQLAVWKLSHEGSQGSPATLFTAPSSGVTSNGFSVTGNINSAVIAESNSLLTGVLNDDGIAPMQLDVLSNGTYQDYLVPMGTFIAIPEPALCAVIFGFGALGCALARRRHAA